MTLALGAAILATFTVSYDWETAAMAVMEIVPGKTRIGWIGTGVMGRSMCGHLIAKGFAATVYNRTKDKAKALLDKGAKWADSPKAVAEQSRRRLRHRRLSQRRARGVPRATTARWPAARRATSWST